MPIQTRGLAPLLQVFDMPASLRFYRDQLGFRVVSDSGRGDESDWVLLDLEGISLMLNTQYESDSRPGEPDACRTKGHGDVGLYFGCPDVDGAYAHMRGVGLEVNPPEMTGYGFRALSLVDPDGYNLIFHWNPAEKA